MREKLKTPESAGDGGRIRVCWHSSLGAISALLNGPRKKLVLLGGTSLLGLLGLLAVVVVTLAPIRKSSPAVSPARVAPTPLLQEKEADKKSGVEARFEALKRGEFARIQSSRNVREAEKKGVPMEDARVAADRSEAPMPSQKAQEKYDPVKNSVLAGTVEKGIAPPKEMAPPKATPPSSVAASGGCDVGASDPKASAAAILACILEFNAMDSRASPRKPPVKQAPGS